MPTLRRGLVLVAVAVIVAGASYALASWRLGGDTTAPQLSAISQTAPSPATARLCLSKETCAPAPPINSASPASSPQVWGFVGMAAVVLAEARRRRNLRGRSHPLTGSHLPIFRPPIAS